MLEARGQNKHFQSSSFLDVLLLLCDWIFFFILKNQSGRHAIEYCLKFKSARILFRVTQIRVVFFVHTLFCELYSALNGIYHKKLFAVFLPNRWEFLSDYLVTYSGQKSQQIADKKIQMSSEIKLLAGTKVYYCFNSKGDNFKVNQL